MLKILSVGFELASNDVEFVELNTKTSLLDWDIVLFRPEIGDFLTYAETYKGKHSLNDGASFGLKECCDHWQREIKQAYDAGKTVIVFLSELEEVFVDTGRRDHSGTGRNTRTTRIVEPYNNYHALPVQLSAVTTLGSAMKLTPTGVQVLSSFWSDFEEYLEYKVIFTAQDIPATIVTRTGDKPVGAHYRSKVSVGSLLIFPDIDFYRDEFTQWDDKKSVWTDLAQQFAGKLIASVVALDKVLRSSAEVTPEPSWAAEPRYSLTPELSLRAELLEVEQELENIQARKESITENLISAGSIRGLLYEKGVPLENAIIAALKILGFSATSYKSSTSEFDVVFECAEGRLIGEAEGKDSKAINIDKLRQLTMNIHEDLQREEVSSPAKPVLFGNPFRMLELQKRADPFTDKCKTAALTSSTALVSTPDLFFSVQYLIDHLDEEFAHSCRQALLSSVGRVKFPTPPKQTALKDDLQMIQPTK